MPADPVRVETDVERLEKALAACQDLQDLANEYGIADIFQDNGGKVLQCLILLELRISKGREGNDALDDEGNEYELKTLNTALGSSRGVTTHHHLNLTILEKYRGVKAWYVGLYEGIVLQHIIRIENADLEEMYRQWEEKIRAKLPEKPDYAINNPKIPIKTIRKYGRIVYPAPVLPTIEPNEDPTI